MDVLSVGMMVCDIPISPVPKQIFEMEKAEIIAPTETTGGDALNVAVTLAKLGAKAAVVGRVGMDENGRFVVNKAMEAGIDVSGVVYDEEYKTAVSYLLIDEEGEKHSLSDTRIYHRLNDSDVTDQAIQSAEIVYFGSAFQMKQMDHGGIHRLFRRAHTYGKMTAMDTALTDGMEEREKLLQTLTPAFEETDVFLPSYKEAAYLSGQTDPAGIASFFERFGMKIFGVKLGARGCYLTDYKEQLYLPSFHDFEVVDTTGAGDSFVGGFLKGLTLGWSLEECGRLASAVAAHNVAKKGAAEGVPDWETVVSYLRKQEEKR